MKFYYVYVLHNSSKNFIYIGYSEDLKQRIISHNKGENKSTKAYSPLELIHSYLPGGADGITKRIGGLTSDKPRLYHLYVYANEEIRSFKRRTSG